MKIKDVKDLCPIDPEKARECPIEEQEYVPEPQYYDYD